MVRIDCSKPCKPYMNENDYFEMNMEAFEKRITCSHKGRSNTHKKLIYITYLMPVYTISGQKELSLIKKTF